MRSLVFDLMPLTVVTPAAPLPPPPPPIRSLEFDLPLLTVVTPAAPLPPPPPPIRSLVFDLPVSTVVCAMHCVANMAPAVMRETVNRRQDMASSFVETGDANASDSTGPPC